MPNIGQFVLHSMANPPIKAGDYTLQGRQDVAGGPTAPYDGRVRITSPRYLMRSTARASSKANSMALTVSGSADAPSMSLRGSVMSPPRRADDHYTAETVLSKAKGHDCLTRSPPERGWTKSSNSTIYDRPTLTHEKPPRGCRMTLRDLAEGATGTS